MKTLEQIKKDVLYYCGKNATDEEAEEILGFVENNPEVPSEEIIADYYYNC